MSEYQKPYSEHARREHERIFATKKYKVKRGIFQGHIFLGEYVIINGEERIWDCDSVGRSYPAEDCEPVREW